MKYMKLKTADREKLLQKLEDMPQYLEDSFRMLSENEIVKRGSNGEFSPVEHVWHLADLEKEGFSFRLHQLLEKRNPVLPDFEGGKIARERKYRRLSIQKGLLAFRAARLANLKTIKIITKAQWHNKGILNGVGEISLCDIPSLLEQHDSVHKEEIETWKIKNA